MSPFTLNDENKGRVSRIVQGIAIALLFSFALIALTEILRHNLGTVIALLAAAPPIALAIWLSRRGHVSTAIFVMATVLLVMSTVVCTLGQGIHDITIVTYPGILVVSSLMLNRRAFIILTGLTLVAVGWLVLGAMFGLFVPRPHSVGNVADLVAVTSALLITAFSVYSLAANMQKVLVQLQDEMNERKQTEQALRESQTMLRLIFDNAFDGISVYEEYPELGTRRLIDCNARYAEIAGRSREELLAIGNTLPLQEDFGITIEHQEFLKRLEQDVYVSRFTWLRPDGKENIVEFAAVPLSINDRYLVIGVDRDITDQVQAARERESLIEELETKNTELEHFTYTVSHDLKSPLITIKGFLGFLEQDAMRGDVARLRADIAHISNAVGNMQQLLDELLELSRIGRLVNPFENIVMRDLVHEAVALVSGQITARDVQVEVAPDMPVVRGDRPRLREVFENLIGNAVRYMGDQPQPRIEIGVRHDNDQTVFYVRDNGIGIEAQNQERVFDLFTKLDPDSEGTGVGLAIVKRIVETHGGRIWVESEGAGHGSTFCFTISA